LGFLTLLWYELFPHKLLINFHRLWKPHCGWMCSSPMWSMYCLGCYHLVLEFWYRLTCFCYLKCEKMVYRYVKSRSDTQLRGKASESATETCEPEAVTSNGQPIVPCGLVAWSLFNDTYRFSVKNEVLDVSKKNIAWKSDQENKFGSDVYPKNFQSGSLIGGGKLNSSIPVSISRF